MLVELNFLFLPWYLVHLFIYFHPSKIVLLKIRVNIHTCFSLFFWCMSDNLNSIQVHCLTKKETRIKIISDKREKEILLLFFFHLHVETVQFNQVSRNTHFLLFNSPTTLTHQLFKKEKQVIKKWKKRRKKFTRWL